MIVPHSLLSVTSVKGTRSSANVKKHEAPPRRPLELIGSGGLPCFEMSQTTTVSVADKLKRPPSRKKIKKPTENKDPQQNPMPVTSKSSGFLGKASSISLTSRPKTAISSQRKTPVRRKSAPVTSSKPQEKQKHTTLQPTSKPQEESYTEMPSVTQQSTNLQPFLMSLVSDVVPEIPAIAPEPLMSVQELQQYLQDIIDPSPKTQHGSEQIEEALEARITEILQNAQKSSVTERESPTSSVEGISPVW